MFFLGALLQRVPRDRGCSDSTNTSQSRGPQSWNGIAHPESEKVKFIFVFFFSPFSLSLSHIQNVSRPPRVAHSFFTMMYNSHLLIKKNSA